MKALRTFARDEAGQALVITSLCIVVLLGFVGFAIDVGHLRLVKSQMQAAADAAALASGLEIRVCSTTLGCSYMQAAAKMAMQENGYPSVTFLMNCNGTPGTGVTLMLNDPPCAAGISDPNSLPGSLVEVIATQNVTTHFAKLFGLNNVKVSARAVSARGAGPCIYALDPHGSGAITVPIGLGIQSTCAVVDESDSSSAITCLVAFGTAPRIAVTGGVAGLLCGSSPPPVTGVPVPAMADPMGYLPAPPHATDACPTTAATGNTFTGSKSAVNLTLTGTYTFNPGVYCGGISITAGVLMTTTFTPGIYILRDGPGLLGTQGGLTVTLSALSKITAKNVMFYNEGLITNPAASVGGFSITTPAAAGLSNIVFSAATGGQYGGVLFFQAHGVTTSGTYLANLLQGSKLEGAIYEPDAKVAYAVGAISNNYNILVAKDLNFTGQVLSRFGSNYASLATGSPLQSDVSVLVQ